MGFFARKLHDDRGRPHELYGTGFDVGAVTDEATLPREALERVRGRLARLHIRDRSGVPKPVWIGTLLGVVISTVLRYTFPSHDHTILYVAVGLLLLLFLVTYRGLSGARGRELRAALLAEKRCPGCGYDISGCERAEDGCRVCPECGGAWKLPRRPCGRCGHDLSPAGEHDEGFLHCPACGIECEGRL